MAKYSVSTSTESDSAKVVLTSAVGTTRKPCSEIECVTSATQSAGRKSIAFMSTTQSPTVSASGATKR